MAVVGKGFAVLQTGNVRISGFLAWLAWAGVHLQFLAQSSLRASVFLQWVWTYITGQRGSRLIVNHHESGRSEEHTSELQSHLNLVCRLLLEKKKKNIRTKYHAT